MAARPIPSEPPGPPSSEEPANDCDAAPLPLTPEQEQLVEAGLPMVKQCAAEVASRFQPRVHAEELLAPGTIALRQAVLSYQADLHPSFPVYARHHIRGRMIDAVRTEHFSLRARVEHAMERAYEIFEAQHKLDGDLAHDDEQVLLDSARQGCDDMLASVYVAGLLEEEASTPEDDLVAREDQQSQRDALQKARDALAPAEQTVVRLLYEEGMTMEEAAREMSVHFNTVQRRHTKALRTLRKALAGR